MAKEVDVQVRYIPDTSALKNALSGTQNIDFKIGGSGLKKELLAPVQNAMKEVNKALASGADNKTLLKLFQDVNVEVDKTRQKLSTMGNEINATFNSAGNQQMLKQLEQYRKELSKVEKQADNWNKNYGNKTISTLKTNAQVDSSSQARKLKAELESSEKLTQQEQDRLKAIKEYVDTLDKRNELQKKGITASGYEDQRRNIVDKINNLESSVQTESYNANAAKDIASMNTYLANTTSYATGEINKLNTSLKNEQLELDETKKEVTKFGDILTGTFLGTSLNNLFQTGLRRGIQFFKEYDETLTRTMMVTGMTRDEVNSLTSSYNKLANQLSSTTKDVAAAQLVFYQQGLGTQEALAMTEASIAISKTGGIEAGEAANRLTAAIRGYKLAASDAMNIADKMSALDAAAASSVDELTIAMQKSASQARMAGLDLDYYMAYLSTMQEVTREAPENIGTAMKSITSRLQEITDLGAVEEDGTTFSNVAKALNSVGIAAVDSSGQLRSLQDVMNELGPMWAKLDKNHKAYLATVLAGNRQQSRFIALMDNYDRAMELVSVSQNASGESAKQLRAYNQGLEASFTRLSNAWQQFATNIADSDAIKGIVDFLSDLIELLNKIPKKVTSTLVVFGALNKIITTLSRVNLGDFGTFISGKLGFDKFLDPIDKADNKITKLGKTVKGFVSDSVKKLDEVTVSFGKNTQGAEDTAEAVNKIEDSAIGASVATVQLNTNKSATAGIIAAESKVTDDYKDVAGEAAENIGKMGTEIANNKTIMDSNDTTMEKEINDTKALASVSINAESLAKAKNDLAEINDTINDYRTNKDYAASVGASNMQDILDKYKAENPKEYSKYAGAYKRSMIAASKKRNKMSDAGQLDLGLQVSDMTELDYIRKRIPALDSQLAEVEKYFEAYTKQIDASIAVENQKKKAVQENIKVLEGSTKIESQVTEAKIKEGEASTLAAEADIKEAESSNIASQADLKEASVSNIDNNGIDVDFWGKDSKTFAKLGNNYQKNNGLEGLSFNLGEVRKQFSMTSVMSSVMIGSFAKMGTSALGLGDDLSSAVGTFAGFANLLKGFGAKGIIVAAAITGIQYVMNKLIPTSERVQEKLNKLQNEMDELNQKQSDIKGYLDTYNELSGKLTRTEEETSQLNDATKALAETLPNVVTGYDNYGNAIINTTRAMEELQAVQAKQTENAQNQLKTYGELQKSAQNGQKQATIWTSIAGTLLTIVGLATDVVSLGTLSIPGTAIAAAGMTMLGGSAISGIEMTLDQKNENKKIIEENYADIWSQILTIEGSYVDKMKDEHKQTADMLMRTLGQSMLEAARTTGEVYLDDLEKELTNIYSQLDSTVIARINVALTGLEVKTDITPNMSYDEAKEYVASRISDELKKTGFNSEQIDTMVEVVLNIQFKGAIDVAAAKDAIDKAIKDSKIGDDTYRNRLDRFGQALGQLDQETLAMMRDLGLLDAKFAQSYTSIEDSGLFDNKSVGITEMFRDDEGNIDKATAALNTYELALRQIEYYEGILKSDSALGYASLMENYAEQIMEATGMSWEELFGADKLTMLGRWGAEYNRAAEGLKYYKGVADTAYASIETKLLPSFKEVSQTLKDTKEYFDSFYSLADHLDDTKGIVDVDGLSQLFDIFAQFEETSLDSVDNLNAWRFALESVNNGLSIENGMLHLNAEAMNGVNTMITEMTKAKYRQQIADIEAAQSSLRLQKTVLQAELDTVTNRIEALEAGGKANYNEAEFEEETRKTLASNLDAINLNEVKSQEDKVKKILEVNQAGFNQLLAMEQQYKNKENASFTLKDYSGEYKKAVEKFKQERTDNLLELVTDNYDETLAGLKSYQSKLQDQIAILDTQILQGDVEKKFFQDIIDGKVDLGKSMDLGDASKSVKDYNEQLKKTLTLLEKIEGLQHTIDENSTFKDLYDGYDGASVGRLLVTNLNLSKQQYEVYKDLFDMQQQITDQAAGDLLDSPYGGMFQIMKNGDIGWSDASMYDKYKNLPDEMQEDIDNLVQAYQNERDELRDTEKELANYAKAVKDAREELVNMEITIENWLVEALKNREKIMNDARQKALDDEIAMIEAAVEARKKANDRENQNKDLYKAQEALRRATLDSSGKNNAQLLQLQQDLEDKQLEIAEKRFEDDMDDRKQWLQDTKDAEQETYDYRLETMTWYWEQVQEIQAQGTEAMMETLIHWNEEYNAQSRLQQEEMEREWFNTMEAMREATDMGAELNALTQGIIDVTSEVESMNISISALPGTWQRATDAANAYSAAARSAASYGGGSYVSGGTTDNNTGGAKNPETEINQYIGWVGKTVEFDAGNTTVDTYNTDGSKASKAKDSWGSSKNVKVLNSANIPGIGWSLLTDGFTGYIPVKYFTSGGFGPWGAKKITPAYARGGMVDFTGPAWVDGTQSHPEAFLSAYQTEQIGALANALDTNTINNVSGDSNVTFGSINFNVASMSSSTDGKKALEVFVQGANDLMAKKGIGTRLNMNIK